MAELGDCQSGHRRSLGTSRWSKIRSGVQVPLRQSRSGPAHAHVCVCVCALSSSPHVVKLQVSKRWEQGKGQMRGLIWVTLPQPPALPVGGECVRPSRCQSSLVGQCVCVCVWQNCCLCVFHKKVLAVGFSAEPHLSSTCVVFVCSDGSQIC